MKNNTLNYSEFLFLRLVELICPLEINGFNDVEYDIQFDTIKQWYATFEASKYNNVNQPEYECIVEYLNTSPELPF